MSSPDRRESESRTIDAWQGSLLIASIMATSVAFSIHALSFLHVKDAVLACLLIPIALLQLARTRFPFDGFKAFLPFWILLGWCVVLTASREWARVPAYAVVEIARIATLVLAATLSFELLKRPLWRAHLFTAIASSAVLVAVIGLLQYAGWLPDFFPVFPGYDQRMYSVFGNQDLFGGYVAMGIPMVVYSFSKHQRREIRLLVALFILLAALCLSGSRSAWLAMLIGSAVVLGTKGVTKRRILILAIPSFVVCLILVFIVPESTIARVTNTFGEEDVGGRLRLWFWAGTFEMIRTSPWLGIGLGQYAFYSPIFLGEVLWAEGGDAFMHNEIHTLHAHSDPLEHLAEFGAIGVLPILWMTVRLLRVRGREWGPLAALIAFSCLNATFQSAAHALCALVLIACLLARGKTRSNDSPQRWQAHVLGSLGVVVCTVLIALVTFGGVTRPSFAIRRADVLKEAATTDKQVDDSINAYVEQTRAPWARYSAYEAMGIIYLERQGYEGAREFLSQASHGLQTGRVWLYLGISEEMQGNPQQAREHYVRCLEIWPTNLDAWERVVRLQPQGESWPSEADARRWLTEADVERLFH